MHALQRPHASPAGGRTRGPCEAPSRPDHSTLDYPMHTSPFVLLVALTLSACASEAAYQSPPPPPPPPPPPAQADYEGRVTQPSPGTYVLRSGSGGDLAQRAGQPLTWTAPPGHHLYFDFTGAPLSGGPARTTLSPGATLQRTVNDEGPGCFEYRVWARPAGGSGEWTPVSGVAPCPLDGDDGTHRIDIRPKIIVQ